MTLMHTVILIGLLYLVRNGHIGITCWLIKVCECHPIPQPIHIYNYTILAASLELHVPPAQMHALANTACL